MSQGQKKRVALAKSLTEEASLYLWDERKHPIARYIKIPS
ncbi:ATP-binding cassette domain-containing protein [Lactobacillus delbrueckii subsp. lactis]|nr:ATP-binding cassette domain-containing protein [Lactobacillus delbrueckii]MCD5560351.1 ATP-binding cassette domain-containing protein [Lactobacillus delbrueckii subsp. lactis]